MRLASVSLLSVVATVALTSCIGTKIEMLVPQAKYPAVIEDSVQVFLSLEEVRQKGYEYEPVARIRATGRPVAPVRAPW